DSPQAEMWFGTHPTTPTRLDDGSALADIADLPYLVKLLAAEQPLSIQAHPPLDHARVGFEAENAAGIPVDHPERTYKDANHKPEMLVALSDFIAMAGFRDPTESAETFRQLAELVGDAPLADTLATMATELAEGNLQAVFGQLIAQDGVFWQADGGIRAVVDAVGDSVATVRCSRDEQEDATMHQDDYGVVVTLLMT